MRIKEIMKEKGITQTELARKMGISQSTLSVLLKNPTLSTLQRIAYTLGVEIIRLYDSPEKWYEVQKSLPEKEQLKNILQMRHIENIRDKFGSFEEYEEYKEEEKRILGQQIKVICPHCGQEIKLKLDFDVPNTQR